MTKYLCQFSDFEKYIVEGEENRNKCLRYLLRKYGGDFPAEMARCRTVPDDWKVTWP